MDFNPFDPTLVTLGAGLPLSGLAATAFHFGRKNLQTRQSAAEAQAAHRDAQRVLFEAALTAQPPAGGLALQAPPSDADQTARDRSGRVLLVAIGSFGAELVLGCCQELARAGLDPAIGSILLVEADRARRERFLTGLPTVFRDGRVVELTDLAQFAGGFANEEPEAVLRLIHRWGPAVVQATRRVCQVHQRRQLGDEPAVTIVANSYGGSAAVGPTILREITATFRRTAVYNLVALPVSDYLRQRVLPLYERYRDASVRGTIVACNRAGVEVLNDRGLIWTLTGLIGAAGIADASVELNNALTLLFDKTPGGLAAYSTWVHELPAYRVEPSHPAVPPRAYVYRGALVSAMQTGLDAVWSPEFHSLGGEGMAGGPVAFSSHFDLVLAVIESAGLKRCEDVIREGRELAARTHGVPATARANQHLLFAPTAAPIAVEEPVCPVAVVSLRAVADPRGLLARLTTPVTAPTDEPSGRDTRPLAAD